MISDFEYVPYDFVSFPLFVFILEIKIKNRYFECHSNTLIFFMKKKIMLDLNISCQIVSDLV